MDLHVHTLGGVGNGYVELPAFDNEASSLRAALERATLQRHRGLAPGPPVQRRGQAPALTGPGLAGATSVPIPLRA